MALETTEGIFDLLSRDAIDLRTALARIGQLPHELVDEDTFDETKGIDLSAMLRRFGAAEPPSTPHRFAERSASGKILLRDAGLIEEACAGPRPAPAPLRLAALARPSESGGRIRVTRPSPHVAVVTMCDGENMMTQPLQENLRQAFDALVEDGTTRAIVLCGEDRWFSGGGTPDTVAGVREGSVLFTSLVAYRVLLDCPLPTVAAVNGHAFGGGLAMGLYADAIVLAEDRKYATNFLRHGITPGVGSTHIVPHRLGEVLGNEMLYSARLYSGKQLRDRGAPLDFVPCAEVLPRAIALAAEFASHPRELVLRLKRRLSAGLRRDVDAATREELHLHREAALTDGHVRAARAGRSRTRSSLGVRFEGTICYATIHRPEAHNSFNQELLSELHAALDEAEHEQACRLFVLEGCDGTFCSGMDLAEAAQTPSPARGPLYMELLSRFAASALIVVSAVDGRVVAGGVGFLAASDVVLATPRSTMSLSEVLFGMLPAQLMPYLIRRAGFQTAYRMTLTTSTLLAVDAERVGLVDGVTNDLGDRIRQLERRLARVSRQTILDAKAYFRKLWLIDQEMEATALGEFCRLLDTSQFKEKANAFLASRETTEEA